MIYEYAIVYKKLTLLIGGPQTIN